MCACSLWFEWFFACMRTPHPITEGLGEWKMSSGFWSKAWNLCTPQRHRYYQQQLDTNISMFGQFSFSPWLLSLCCACFFFFSFCTSVLFYSVKSDSFTPLTWQRSCENNASRSRKAEYSDAKNSLANYWFHSNPLLSVWVELLFTHSCSVKALLRYFGFPLCFWSL